MHLPKIILLIIFILPAAGVSLAQPEGIDPEYLETLTRRSENIVSSLGIGDPARRERVRDLIINQYYELSKIHDERDARLAGAGDAEKESIRIEADARLYRLHAAYLAGLSAELSPQQVDMVKDGMTYGVLQHTYNAYLDLLDELTEEQKRYILANLTEARELAMDAGSSEEKHAWFGKYKGRINNYLSDQGYDLKKAEEMKKNQGPNR
jgi:hypothetical protein